MKKCPNPKCASTDIRYGGGDTWYCKACGDRFIDLHDPHKRAQIPQPNYVLYVCPQCTYHTAGYDNFTDTLVCMNCNYRGSPNGQHRQSPQGTHNHPSAGSNSSSGAAVKAAAIQAQLSAAQTAAAQQSGLNVGGVSGGGGGGGISGGGGANAYAHPIVVLPARKIPYAGITVGELLAWRCWRLTPHGFLQSGYKDTIWLPGVQQDAGPKDLDNGWGIHAFKKEASKQLHDAVYEYSCTEHQRNGVHRTNCPVAIGTVALWGRVIEHDLGYRAEHARVASIEALAAVPLAEYAQRLVLLRKSYCPALPDSTSTKVQTKQPKE